jgi:hypothetical protein
MMKSWREGVHLRATALIDGKSFYRYQCNMDQRIRELAVRGPRPTSVLAIWRAIVVE